MSQHNSHQCIQEQGNIGAAVSTWY